MFSMLDAIQPSIIATIDSTSDNMTDVIERGVAARECIMRNGPSHSCSTQSPFDMVFDILLEGFITVFIRNEEYKDKDPVFIRGVGKDMIRALIQHYDKEEDICDDYVDRLMDAYNHFKDR